MSTLDSAANPVARLRSPAYAKDLRAARAAGDVINLRAQVGGRAWERAKQCIVGHRLVITLDIEHGPAAYDLTCCDGLDVTLNAVDCNIALARQVAVRMCEHGARLVVLLHPALPQFTEFFYGEART